MRRLVGLLCGLLFVTQAYAQQSVSTPVAIDTSQFATATAVTAAQAAAANALAAAQAITVPVRSVNALTGAVVIPTLCRQPGVATGDGAGNYTLTFPNTTCSYSTINPTCWTEVAATNTNYVFSQPVVTAKSLTAVTVNVQAALKLLSISLGALTVWTTPPAGTVVTITCVGPS